nr:lysine-specific histone demethylase 1 homolog 3 [Tanacetum cinerariifolium]
MEETLVVKKATISGQDVTPSDHVRHALLVLRKLFGEVVVRDPVASIVTDWGRDPFSYGAYSYVAVGAAAEVEAITAAKRHSESERSEVRDIIRIL